MIAYEDALKIVLENVPEMPEELVPLNKAQGRVLASDIIANCDSPPFHRSAMDGYALRTEDVQQMPQELRIVDVLSPGHIPAKSVGPGEAIKIMTGAIIPPDADAVVMLEGTQELPGSRVLVRKTPRPGENICWQGENFRQGQTLISAGQTLQAPQIALCAFLGLTYVSVSCLPHVRMIATGTEVVPVEATPNAAQIRDCNSITFAALAKSLSIDVELLGIVPDEHEALRNAFKKALEADVVIITAGVSKGESDLVPDTLQELGAEILFREIAIKPGKPTLFGRCGKTIIFGLPGNPVSVQLTTRILVLPALKKMCGWTKALPLVAHARLTECVSHKPQRCSYMPALLTFREGCLWATPVDYRGSGDILGPARSNGWIIVPKNVQKIEKEQLADVLINEEACLF